MLFLLIVMCVISVDAIGGILIDAIDVILVDVIDAILFDLIDAMHSVSYVCHYY